MHQSDLLVYVKFNIDNLLYIDFLRKNLRTFYSKKIAIWQYGFPNFKTGLFFVQKGEDLDGLYLKCCYPYYEDV